MTNKIKAVIRKEILDTRRQLDAKIKQRNSTSIKDHLCNWRTYKKANTIMVFLSMKDEPQTDAIIEDALKNGKTVCVPRLLPTYGLMEAVKVVDLKELIPGKLGIREPKPDPLSSVVPATIDLILVPGVGFDLEGNRLGMGAGYYDRYLLQTYQAVLLGVAWQMQLQAHIPTDSHDVKMHFLLTETGIVHCTTGKM